MTNATIHAALLARIPALAESTESLLRAQFAGLLGQFGENMKGICNSRSYSVWVNTIRGLCDRAEPSDKKPWEHDRGVYTLNDEKVARAARRIAEGAATAWEAKINAKLGELDDATVHADGVRFMISGHRAGKKITIDQDMIVNVSPKGTLFNQFPARIYIDGKFTSAANYAKVFA